MMSTRRQIAIAALIGLLMLTAGASAAFAQAIVPLSQSGGAVCTNLSTPVITLYGWGSAPACPAGWSTLVGQTAAGTVAPVTAVTTTSIAPVTSISTIALRTSTAVGYTAICDQTGVNCGATIGATNMATDGVATTYTVANGGTATTYTWYYRVCQAP